MGPSRWIRFSLALVLGLSLTIPFWSAPQSRADLPQQGWTAGDEGWVWQNPLPQGNPIDTLVAPDSDHVWLLGDTSLFFENGEWKRHTELLDQTIIAASAVDANHIWAVVSDSILFFDGASWSVQYKAEEPTIANIYALDTNHVWACGGGIFFFDGASWQMQSSDAAGGFIWAADDTHAWATGTETSPPSKVAYRRSYILAFNGVSWTRQWESEWSLDSSVWLGPISGASADDVWIAGHQRLLHYDGYSWSNVSVPYTFYDIEMADPIHLWATANDAVLLNSGAGWQQQFSLKGASEISLIGPGEIWVLGDEAAARLRDGTWWSFTFEWGNMGLLSDADISAGDAEHVRALYHGALWLFDGHSWQQEYPVADTNAKFQALFALDKNNAWVSTEQEAFLHYDGASWQPADSAPPLRMFTASDPSSIWGISNTSIVHFDGQAWSESFTDPGNNYLWTDIYAADANHVWVTSKWGQILFFDGNAWTTQFSGDAEPATIDGSAPDNVWVLCYGNPRGTPVLHYNGTSWSQELLPFFISYQEGVAVTTNRVLLTGIRIVGDQRTKGVNILLENNGAGWRQINLGTRNELASVAAPDSGHAWAIGEFGTILAKSFPPPAPPASYPHLYWLAEGYTGAGFNEWLTVGNPGNTVASVQILYCFPDGGWETQDLIVPPNSRSTISVNVLAGGNREVSARIASNQPVVVERPEYFNYGGSTGGHVASAASALSSTWYFAEGYTGPGFDQYVCVFNPADGPATLDFQFQVQGVGQHSISGLGVAAHSRATFRVNRLLGENNENALKLQASVPVVAERVMYFDYGGWTGGSCVMGATILANQYYFAEGTTRNGFAEYLTLQNSGDTAITVDAEYQFYGGWPPYLKSYTLPAASRQTYYVPFQTLPDQDVSVKLSSTSPFLAERPMYFDYTGYGANWTGGHCVIGAAVPASEWFFAEGCTLPGFHEYLCLQNPGDSDATVEIAYLTQEAGALPVQTTVVPAHSRVTSLVNVAAGDGYQLSCRVRVISGPAIVAERPMYFDYNGWDGGHDAVGVVP